MPRNSCALGELGHELAVAARDVRECAKPVVFQPEGEPTVFERVWPEDGIGGLEGKQGALSLAALVWNWFDLVESRLPIPGTRLRARVKLMARSHHCLVEASEDVIIVATLGSEAEKLHFFDADLGRRRLGLQDHHHFCDEHTQRHRT